MNSIRETINFTDMRFISLLQIPTKAGATLVIKALAPLDPDCAEQLRCRPQVFDLDDNPYPAFKGLGLDHELGSCEISIPGQVRFQPKVVTGFKIEKPKKADNGGEREVHFTIKADSTWKSSVRDIFDSVSGKTFDMSIIALQENLFTAAGASAGDDNTEGEAGGRRVDMTTGEIVEDGQEEEPPPLVQDGNTGLVDEVLKDANTLPRAGEMGGTHAKRKPRGKIEVG